MHVARGESAPCALSRSSQSAFAVRGALPPLVVFFLRPARAASPLLRCVPEPLSGDAQGTSHERYATHSPSGARALSLSSSAASGLALFFFSSSPVWFLPRPRARRAVLALPPHAASGHATHEVFGAATPAVRSAPWAVLERRVLSPIVPINFLFVKKPSSHKQTNKK